jgi:hypothetical protein
MKFLILTALVSTVAVFTVSAFPLGESAVGAVQSAAKSDKEAIKIAGNSVKAAGDVVGSATQSAVPFGSPTDHSAFGFNKVQDALKKADKLTQNAINNVALPNMEAGLNIAKEVLNTHFVNRTRLSI